MARDVDPARPALAGDLVRCRGDAHVGDRGQRRVPSRRQLHRHPAEGEHVTAQLRHAPDDDVEDLLGVEDLADLDAAHQRGHGVAHGRGADADLLRAVAVERHFDLRHERQRLHLDVGRTLDRGHRLADFGSLPLQDVELWSEDPHHNRRARPGQHFLDALAQIRQQVPLQSRIAVDDRLDLRHGLGVVHGWVETDPQLGKVDADDLVGHFRPADVRAEVADARDRAQLVARPDGDAPHRVERRGRLLDPVHQEIVFLEVRQELFAEEGERHRRREERGGDDRQGPPRRRDQSREEPPVSPLERADQRGFPFGRRLRQEHQRQRRRHDERHEQRRDDGQHVSQRQRPEKGTRQTIEEEHRQEHEHDDHAAVDDGAAHFQ